MQIKADILEKLRASFREEARDLLSELDEGILALEATPDDADLIGRVFRAIHTIKGSSSTTGLREVAAFTHKVEEIFNAAREGRLRINSQITDLTLQSCDLIGRMLETDDPRALASDAERLSARLAEISPDAQAAPASAARGDAAEAKAVRRRYQIRFQPNAEIFFTGNDPANVLAELESLGECRTTVVAGSVPLLDTLEPEKCYLGWEIDLISDRSESQVKEIFAFVEEGGELAFEVSEYNEALTLRSGDTFPQESLREFFAESQEQLGRVEESLLVLEADRRSTGLVDAIFRSLHNLKGNAGVLLSEKQQAIPARHPLFYIQRVGHATESIVETVRGDANGVISDEQVELLFAGLDLLKRQVTAFAQERIEPVNDEVLLEKLKLSPADFAETAPPAPGAADDDWVLFLQTSSQCLETMQTAIKLAETDAGESRSATRAYLRSARTFLAAARYKNLGALAGMLERQIERLDTLVTARTDPPREIWNSLRDEIRLINESLKQVNAGGPQSQEASRSPAEQRKSDSAKTSPNGITPSSIRVDQEKLDKLMRVAGELLVARGILPELAGKAAGQQSRSALAKEIRDAGAQISRIANELQTTVMAIRMLPLRTVLQKFPRMIRDLARSTGKEINFSTEGDHTELDKTVLEQIGDPLMHLVRNAVDHGIESPKDRAARGKAPAGNVKIVAFNEGTHVVIQISDDGKGLDAAMLKRKAVEKNVVSAEEAAAMSDAQAHQLVFAAGFSTAEKVTDVSGRGVGMDVVRTNLNQLHGTIGIDTRIGHGTTFTIKLPTSLMVSKGVLLVADGQEFILPMNQTSDLVKLQRQAIRAFKDRRFAQIRGQVYPLAFLDEVLGRRLDSGSDHPNGSEPTSDGERSVAIVQSGEQRYGLVVDRFISEVEIIIKPLSASLENLKSYLGAAIMGDGRLVLVLNPAQLCQGSSLAE